MAQISKGTSYSTGDQITASNLNQLVDSATLTSGCIAEQSDAVTGVTTDSLLLQRGSGLFRLTFEKLKDFIQAQALVLSQALTLSGNPTLANHAANKAYVDTKLPLAGGTLTGGLVGTTVNAADITATNLTANTSATVPTPTASGHAANKSYVDGQVSPKANLSLFAQVASQTGQQEINGLIIKWGAHFPTPYTKNVVFNTPFPNEVYNIQLTSYGDDVAVGISSSPAPTVTGFSFLSASNVAVRWVAIGR